jgi:TonB family protein
VETFIDYNQVFLEYFLDGGKKEYTSKPKFKVNNILRNVIRAGEIRVRVIVDRNGQVEAASVLRGINPILDQAVRETVETYRYKPGQINGQLVRFSTSEVFRFE